MAPKAAAKSAPMKKVLKQVVKAKAKPTPKKACKKNEAVEEDDLESTKGADSKLSSGSLKKLEDEQGGPMTKHEKIMLLNDKIAHFKETGVFDFDYNETRCLHNRLHTALKGPEAIDANKALLEVESGGRGKEAKKRVLLRAWWGAYARM